MKRTIKAFCKFSSINPDLIRAVIRQSGGWQSFQDMAPDINNHGIAGGFSGWIYYSDTCAFYAKNQGAIITIVEKWANDCNISTINFVAGFRCIDAEDGQNVGKTLYGNKLQHDTQVANALAWFAAEEVARSFVDWSGSE
jgi:hypothetical protein